MKAILVEEFKKRPQVKEVAEPKIRGPFDALVRIHASGVCHTTCMLRTATGRLSRRFPSYRDTRALGLLKKSASWSRTSDPAIAWASPGCIRPAVNAATA